jgi:hypothetical protein
MPLLGRLGKFLSSRLEASNSVANRCSVLCSEMAVKLIDEPFISATDDKEEWTL